MIPQEIIRRKRDGEALDPASISAFITGLTDGSIGDAQIAAFAMAVFFQGMDEAETVALTCAMRDSGTVLDWQALGFAREQVVDKHSTGGIGDKVSLILAPVIAACGGIVPMISGRGLGHTGGTLDKLDAIPGYRTLVGRDAFAAAVRAAGCAIVGPTDDLAPADRRLYALRDVTATVDSLPLITASILSKKLAAGLGGLVMDVKFGSGAFMRARDDARLLAQAIVEVATGAGVPTVALLTDMNEMLGNHAGNGAEVREAISVLTTGHGDERLIDLTLSLSAEALLLAGLAPSIETARRRVAAALSEGRAAEHFARMVHALGGPSDLLERPDHYLPAAPLTLELTAGRDGYFADYDAREIGLALIELGGGRTDPRQSIDHTVAISLLAQPGTPVIAGEPLARLEARDSAHGERALQRLKTVLRVVNQPPSSIPLIAERITAPAA